MDAAENYGYPAALLLDFPSYLKGPGIIMGHAREANDIGLPGHHFSDHGVLQAEPLLQGANLKEKSAAEGLGIKK